MDWPRFLKNALAAHPDAEVLLEAHATLASLKDALAPATKAAPSAADPASDAEVVEDENADAEALERITSLIGNAEDLGAIARTAVRSRMPKSFRFASYQNLEGRVDVASLRTSEGEHPPDTVLIAEPDVVVGLAAGVLSVDEALVSGDLQGSPGVLRLAFPEEQSATNSTARC